MLLAAAEGIIASAVEQRDVRPPKVIRRLPRREDKPHELYAEHLRGAYSGAEGSAVDTAPYLVTPNRHNTQLFALQWCGNEDA